MNINLANYHLGGHGLSLWISVIFLPKLNSVEEQCFDVEGHTTLVDPNGSKKILTYSLCTKELLSYDIEKDSWSHHAQNVGEFSTVAFMDGIMYGVGFMRLDSNTIYAYDYLNPNSNSPKPVIDVSNTPGRVGPSGLIFINKDTLCVLTGSHYLAGRLITHLLCRLVCSKYRISKNPNKQSGGVDVTAELVSASNYFLKDVNSFRVAPPVLKKKKKHRPRGKKKKRNEGKDVVATECEGTCIFRNFLRGKEQRK